MKRGIFILAFTIFFLGSFCFAETIKLKSGKTVEGKIIEQTDEYIRTELYGIMITFYLDDIESINGQKVAKSEIIAAISDKDVIKNILEESITARKNAKILQVNSLNKTRISELFNEVSEDSFAMDFENKRIWLTRQIKELEVSGLDKILREQAAVQLEKAKVEGAPVEKLQQLKDFTEKMIQMIDQATKEMTDKMKEIKSTTYIIDKTMYVNVGKKWAKMESPEIEQIWQLHELISQYSLEDNEALDSNQLDKFNPEFKTMVDKILSFKKSDIPKIDRINEGRFLNEPCYIIEYVQQEKIIDEIKEAIASFYRTSGQEEGGLDHSRMNIDYASYKEYISKEDYLILGSYMEIASSFNFKLSRKPIKVYRASSSTYNYSLAGIILPEQAQEAILVQNEKEMKDALWDEELLSYSLR